MYPPQPVDPVSAGYNEETGDPVEITVSKIQDDADMQTLMLTLEYHMIHRENGEELYEQNYERDMVLSASRLCANILCKQELLCTI